jgi:hypothetical protein
MSKIRKVVLHAVNVNLVFCRFVAKSLFLIIHLLLWQLQQQFYISFIFPFLLPLSLSSSPLSLSLSLSLPRARALSLYLFFLSLSLSFSLSASVREQCTLNKEVGLYKNVLFCFLY